MMNPLQILTGGDISAQLKSPKDSLVKQISIIGATLIYNKERIQESRKLFLILQTHIIELLQLQQKFKQLSKKAPHHPIDIKEKQPLNSELAKTEELDQIIQRLLADLNSHLSTLQNYQAELKQQRAEIFATFEAIDTTIKNDVKDAVQRIMSTPIAIPVKPIKIGAKHYDPDSPVIVDTVKKINNAFAKKDFVDKMLAVIDNQPSLMKLEAKYRDSSSKAYKAKDSEKQPYIDPRSSDAIISHNILLSELKFMQTMSEELFSTTTTAEKTLLTSKIIKPSVGKEFSSITKSRELANQCEQLQNQFEKTNKLTDKVFRMSKIVASEKACYEDLKQKYDAYREVHSSSQQQTMSKTPTPNPFGASY